MALRSAEVLSVLKTMSKGLVVKRIVDSSLVLKSLVGDPAVVERLANILSVVKVAANRMECSYVDVLSGSLTCHSGDRWISTNKLSGGSAGCNQFSS